LVEPELSQTHPKTKMLVSFENIYSSPGIKGL
jgi:hypothetical protein